MLAVLRPALAVLLLVGVGVVAVDRDGRCCGEALTDGRVLAEAEDDEARIGKLAVALPAPVRLVRPELPPQISVAAVPPPADRAVDVLTAAPKTSPPA